MGCFARSNLLGVAILVLTASSLMSSAVGASIVLSDNITNANSGTEPVSGTTWVASSFGTGSSTSTLSSVSLLLLQMTASGTAEVAIYSDGGLQPGVLDGVLTSPASYSSRLAATSFTTNGISLASDSTYWVVLEALSGTFQWGWTSDDTGSGIGFQDTWSQSIDSGNSWFTFDSSPTQMTVVAATAAVPEPGSLVLGAIGTFNLLLGYALRRRLTGLGRALGLSARVAGIR